MQSSKPVSSQGYCPFGVHSSLQTATSSGRTDWSLSSAAPQSCGIENMRMRRPPCKPWAGLDLIRCVFHVLTTSSSSSCVTINIQLKYLKSTEPLSHTKMHSHYIICSLYRAYVCVCVCAYLFIYLAITWIRLRKQNGIRFLSRKSPVKCPSSLRV